MITHLFLWSSCVYLIYFHHHPESRGAKRCLMNRDDTPSNLLFHLHALLFSKSLSKVSLCLRRNCFQVLFPTNDLSNTYRKKERKREETLYEVCKSGEESSLSPSCLLLTSAPQTRQEEGSQEEKSCQVQKAM